MPSVPESAVLDRFALTPAQLGLLFEVLSEPADHLFVERVVCPLYGRLDFVAFGRVWRSLVARHSSLRTGFLVDNPEGPVQVVYREADLDVRVADWTHLAICEREAMLERTLAEESTREFDLLRPPLMRLTLARTTPEETLLIWSSHHLILDGWSCWILLCEAAWLYLAETHGIVLDLPAPPSFLDYARWLTREDRAAQHAEFWQKYLSGCTSVRPAAVRSGARQFHHDRTVLSKELSSGIAAWLRCARRSLNTLMQAAWALVLGEEQKGSEALFGTVFSGRSSSFPGSMDVIGLMISVLPVRVPLPGEMPVETWLDLVEQRHAGMLPHESCTVQEAQRWSGMERGSPLFDSVLVIMNIDPQDRIPDLGFRMGRPRYFANASYPLGVNVIPGEEIAVEMLYDERYYTKDKVRMLGETLRSALTAILETQDGTVVDLQRRTHKHTRMRRAAGRRESLDLILDGATMTAPANGKYAV